MDLRLSCLPRLVGIRIASRMLLLPVLVAVGIGHACAYTITIGTGTKAGAISFSMGKRRVGASIPRSRIQRRT